MLETWKETDRLTNRETEWRKTCKFYCASDFSIGSTLTLVFTYRFINAKFTIILTVLWPYLHSLVKTDPILRTPLIWFVGNELLSHVVWCEIILFFIEEWLSWGHLAEQTVIHFHTCYETILGALSRIYIYISRGVKRICKHIYTYAFWTNMNTNNL